MDIRDRFLRGLAGQLGRPEGLRGRLVGQTLNRRNVQAVTAAVRACGLAAGSVDAVITVNTIYFVADIDRAFEELARVLGPAGRAVVGLAGPAAMATMPLIDHGFIVRPVEDVASTLRSAGLGVVQRRRVGDGVGDFHLLVARRG